MVLGTAATFLLAARVHFAAFQRMAAAALERGLADELDHRNPFRGEEREEEGGHDAGRDHNKFGPSEELHRGGVAGGESFPRVVGGHVVRGERVLQGGSHHEPVRHERAVPRAAPFQRHVQRHLLDANHQIIARVLVRTSRGLHRRRSERRELLGRHGCKRHGGVHGEHQVGVHEGPSTEGRHRGTQPFGVVVGVEPGCPRRLGRHTRRRLLNGEGVAREEDALGRQVQRLEGFQQLCRVERAPRYGPGHHHNHVLVRLRQQAAQQRCGVRPKSEHAQRLLKPAVRPQQPAVVVVAVGAALGPAAGSESVLERLGVPGRHGRQENGARNVVHERVATRCGRLLPAAGLSVECARQQALRRVPGGGVEGGGEPRGGFEKSALAGGCLGVGRVSESGLHHHSFGRVQEGALRRRDEQSVVERAALQLRGLVVVHARLHGVAFLFLRVRGLRPFFLLVVAVVVHALLLLAWPFLRAAPAGVGSLAGERRGHVERREERRAEREAAFSARAPLLFVHQLGGVPGRVERVRRRAPSFVVFKVRRSELQLGQRGGPPHLEPQPRRVQARGEVGRVRSERGGAEERAGPAGQRGGGVGQELGEVLAGLGQGPHVVASLRGVDPRLPALVHVRVPLELRDPVQPRLGQARRLLEHVPRDEVGGGIHVELFHLPQALALEHGLELLQALPHVGVGASPLSRLRPHRVLHRLGAFVVLARLQTCSGVGCRGAVPRRGSSVGAVAAEVVCSGLERCRPRHHFGLGGVLVVERVERLVVPRRERRFRLHGAHAVQKRAVVRGEQVQVLDQHPDGQGAVQRARAPELPREVHHQTHRGLVAERVGQHVALHGDEVLAHVARESVEQRLLVVAHFAPRGRLPPVPLREGLPLFQRSRGRAEGAVVGVDFPQHEVDAPLVRLPSPAVVHHPRALEKVTRKLGGAHGEEPSVHALGAPGPSLEREVEVCGFVEKGEHVHRRVQEKRVDVHPNEPIVRAPQLPNQRQLAESTRPSLPPL
mmetsp:Transcript_195/g.352  ORF Transcript_195/g.352 Transcript_195/m.352 type:complete len:1002 (-) Transcript_195:58-3063(-)